MPVLGPKMAGRRVSWLAAALGAMWCGGLACSDNHGQTASGDAGATGGADAGAAAGTGGQGGGGASNENDGAVFADVSQPLEVAPPVDKPAPVDASNDVPAGAPLTIEALQVAGTHNSYHEKPPIVFDASHNYTQKPLDQQLDGGVRSLELDLHQPGDGTFDVYHITTIDSKSSCKKLDNCLNIVATWSNAHRNHVPIFIWMELKDDVGGQPITDLLPIETVVKTAVGDRLLTPAWLRGQYASPRERIMKAGWPTLDEARGKIMVMLINKDARTKAYAHDGTSLDDRLMWINASVGDFAQPWAVVVKDLDQPGDMAAAHAAHMLLGVNTCAINLTDDACTARTNMFMQAGVHMLDDDLPFQLSGRTYWLQLPGGSPGCNPVTAPAACRGMKLE